MSHFFKINYFEKISRVRMGCFALPWKFFMLLFYMYGLHAFNFLLIWLSTSCSTKTVVQKLKKLQPQNITESNSTSQIKYEYPLVLNDATESYKDYSFETFTIIISIVLLFCFINSEYPSKIYYYFKNK